jgi:hypothetical protein
LVSVYTATHLISDGLLKIIACTSTTSLTVLTAFNVVKLANDRRRAWRLLNIALSKYLAGCYTMAQLLQDYEEAETIVSTVDFQYGSTVKDENSKVEKIKRLD